MWFVLPQRVSSKRPCEWVGFSAFALHVISHFWWVRAFAQQIKSNMRKWKFSKMDWWLKHVFSFGSSTIIQQILHFEWPAGIWGRERERGSEIHSCARTRIHFYFCSVGKTAWHVLCRIVSVCFCHVLLRFETNACGAFSIDRAITQQNATSRTSSRAFQLIIIIICFVCFTSIHVDCFAEQWTLNIILDSIFRQLEIN